VAVSGSPKSNWDSKQNDNSHVLSTPSHDDSKHNKKSKPKDEGDKLNMSKVMSKSIEKIEVKKVKLMNEVIIVTLVLII